MNNCEFFTVFLCAIASLPSQIPKAALASNLLYAEASGDIRIDHYYETKRVKDKTSATLKYLPSLDCLSFGVAVAVSFQSNRLLIQLWYFGIIVGVLWWILYWQWYHE